MDDTEFLQLVDNVCSRPGMYTLDGTFPEVAAFLGGIRWASPSFRDDEPTLNEFVTSRLGVPSKYWWAGAIRLTVPDDEEQAIAKLRDLLTEFVNLRKTNSLEEIRQLAARERAQHVETEPAKVWRQFLAARFSGDREQIEPLIMPHTEAAVLWRGDGYPPGVAYQLESISESYVVSVVAGSIDSGEVSLATELGVIRAYLIEGQWRIDATMFIENDLTDEVKYT